MSTTTLWTKEKYPVIYEGNVAKAVLVDINTFEQIELILDNLLNREAEAEDSILASSQALQELISRAKLEQPTSNWKIEIDEL